jgi:hypothetical protein
MLEEIVREGCIKAPFELFFHVLFHGSTAARIALLAVTVSLLSCSCCVCLCSGSAPVAGTVGDHADLAAPGSCAFPNVAPHARTVPLLTLPAGCAWTFGGSPFVPAMVETPELLSAVTACPAVPGVDLVASDLYVVQMPTPTGWAGSEVLDDGSALTIGTRVRPSCAGDAAPAGDTFVAFQLPKGAVRSSRAASCTLPIPCP